MRLWVQTQVLLLFSEARRSATQSGGAAPAAAAPYARYGAQRKQRPLQNPNVSKVIRLTS